MNEGFKHALIDFIGFLVALVIVVGTFSSAYIFISDVNFILS